jgi:hypothetical protein
MNPATLVQLIRQFILTRNHFSIFFIVIICGTSSCKKETQTFQKELEINRIENFRNTPAFSYLEKNMTDEEFQNLDISKYNMKSSKSGDLVIEVPVKHMQNTILLFGKKENLISANYVQINNYTNKDYSITLYNLKKEKVRRIRSLNGIIVENIDFRNLSSTNEILSTENSTSNSTTLPPVVVEAHRVSSSVNTLRLWNLYWMFDMNMLWVFNFTKIVSIEQTGIDQGGGGLESDIVDLYVLIGNKSKGKILYDVNNDPNNPDLRDASIDFDVTNLPGKLNVKFSYNSLKKELVQNSVKMIGTLTHSMFTFSNIKPGSVVYFDFEKTLYFTAEMHMIIPGTSVILYRQYFDFKLSFLDKFLFSAELIQKEIL